MTDVDERAHGGAMHICGWRSEAHPVDSCPLAREESESLGRIVAGVIDSLERIEMSEDGD